MSKLCKMFSAPRFHLSPKLVLPHFKDVKAICKFTEEAKGRSVETVNLAYTSYESTSALEAPEAPPLIINHGLFGSKANWNSLSKAFHQKSQPQRKVIAIDSRNHGDSPHVSAHTYLHLAEDLKALMGNLNLEKASLLGHSMGGRAVMMFALKYPELVDKLIVADISPIHSSQTLRETGDIIAILAKIQIPKQGTLSTAKMQVDKQLARKITNKLLRGFLLTNLIQKSDGSFAWRVNLSVLAANYRENIEKFPQFNFVTYPGPTLFIGGEKSDFLPKDHESKIKDIFSNAEFKYIPDAGHWLHSDKPKEFLDICIEFLNKK